MQTRWPVSLAHASLAARRKLECDGIDDLIGDLVEVNGPLDAEAAPGTSTSGAESPTSCRAERKHDLA